MAFQTACWSVCCYAPRARQWPSFLLLGYFIDLCIKPVRCMKVWVQPATSARAIWLEVYLASALFCIRSSAPDPDVTRPAGSCFIYLLFRSSHPRPRSASFFASFFIKQYFAIPDLHFLLRSGSPRMHLESPIGHFRFILSFHRRARFAGPLPVGGSRSHFSGALPWSRRSSSSPPGRYPILFLTHSP